VPETTATCKWRPLLVRLSDIAGCKIQKTRPPIIFPPLKMHDHLYMTICSRTAGAVGDDGQPASVPQSIPIRQKTPD